MALAKMPPLKSQAGYDNIPVGSISEQQRDFFLRPQKTLTRFHLKPSILVYVCVCVCVCVRVHVKP